VYVPAADIPFHRVSFPKGFNEHNAPPGYNAFMAEITANEGDGVWELDDDEVTSRVIQGLERIGFLDPSEVTYRKVVRFTYGYPVYDLDYHKNSRELRALIEAEGIRLLGRFAQFEYINSDVCVERALKLAAALDAEPAR